MQYGEVDQVTFGFFFSFFICRSTALTKFSILFLSFQMDAILYLPPSTDRQLMTVFLFIYICPPICRSILYIYISIYPFFSIFSFYF